MRCSRHLSTTWLCMIIVLLASLSELGHTIENDRALGEYMQCQVCKHVVEHLQTQMLHPLEKSPQQVVEVQQRMLSRLNAQLSTSVELEGFRQFTVGSPVEACSYLGLCGKGSHPSPNTGGVQATATAAQPQVPAPAVSFLETSSPIVGTQSGSTITPQEQALAQASQLQPIAQQQMQMPVSMPSLRIPYDDDFGFPATSSPVGSVGAGQRQPWMRSSLQPPRHRLRKRRLARLQAVENGNGGRVNAGSTDENGYPLRMLQDVTSQVSLTHGTGQSPPTTVPSWAGVTGAGVGEGIGGVGGLFNKPIETSAVGDYSTDIGSSEAELASSLINAGGGYGGGGVSGGGADKSAGAGAGGGVGVASADGLASEQVKRQFELPKLFGALSLHLQCDIWVGSS
eukprot:GFYU01007629.1.p1 GENE.GFYU01007629.1~~GFYU01007629.1.p1  ORF type:complete len:398 (-),score=66.29 GFYU01007629.1:177-1370(-)